MRPPACTPAAQADTGLAGAGPHVGAAKDVTMTRIRTRKELLQLYPEYFNVLLGYWMDGVNEKEKLDSLAERLKNRKRKVASTPFSQVGQEHTEVA